MLRVLHWAWQKELRNCKKGGGKENDSVEMQDQWDRLFRPPNNGAIFNGEESRFCKTLAGYGKDSPTGLWVFLLTEYSSASSSTRFMYSSKPCKGETPWTHLERPSLSHQVLVISSWGMLSRGFLTHGTIRLYIKCSCLTTERLMYIQNHSLWFTYDHHIANEQYHTYGECWMTDGQDWW